MEDARDAEDATKILDGSRICGARVKVEMSNGGKKEREADVDEAGAAVVVVIGPEDAAGGPGQVQEEVFLHLHHTVQSPQKGGGSGPSKRRSRSRSDQGLKRGRRLVGHRC